LRPCWRCSTASHRHRAGFYPHLSQTILLPVIELAHVLIPALALGPDRLKQRTGATRQEDTACQLDGDLLEVRRGRQQDDHADEIARDGCLGCIQRPLERGVLLCPNRNLIERHA